MTTTYRRGWVCMYLIPNFFAGDAETLFTRNLPGSDIGGG